MDWRDIFKMAERGYAPAQPAVEPAPGPSLTGVLGRMFPGTAQQLQAGSEAMARQRAAGDAQGAIRTAVTNVPRVVGAVTSDVFNPPVNLIAEGVKSLVGYSDPPPPIVAQDDGFTPPDQTGNLPTFSGQLSALGIRPIGGERMTRPAPASTPRSALPPGVSMSPYDAREDRSYRQVRVMRGGQPTDYSVQREDQLPLAQRPDYERIDGNIFYRDRSNPEAPVLRRVTTSQEQAALRAAALDGLLKQAEALQKGGQGRRSLAQADAETQGVQLGDLGVAMARQRYEASKKTPEDYQAYLSAVQAFRSAAKPSDIEYALNLSRPR